MIGTEFEFFAPRALDEALDLLARHDDAKVLAGGMSLVPVMSLGLAHPAVVVSLNHLADLDTVSEEGDTIRIGALARHKQVGSHPLILRHVPLLAQAARSIGDVQIRNRGTLGGSLAHADPAADYPAVMLVLDARLRLARQGNERVVPAREFFLDVMTTDLAPDELVVEVQLPKLAPAVGVAHERLRRVEGAFPIVTASALVEPGRRAAVGMGGIGPTPVLLEVPELFEGDPGDAVFEAIGQRAYDAAESAMEDLNGSARYRREMARHYSQRALRQALARTREGATR